MRLSGVVCHILWSTAVSVVLLLSRETTSASTSFKDDSGLGTLALSVGDLSLTLLPEDETSAVTLGTTNVVAQVDGLTSDYRTLDTFALRSALLNTPLGYSCGNLVPYWRGYHKHSAANAQ
ncbi:hypothetical protein PSACC_02768 [Paramicrosporidium saccamoebae]|uniref:Uncharacterized protein n=1 Tax=Paramicrosporidium saccamoebae TaxID=1246581 RepID=A0A2H9TI88_9FUNG|nr:hypothetical protein PSACC_02768 [Paramicrosporidium saccamoebae]